MHFRFGLPSPATSQDSLPGCRRKLFGGVVARELTPTRNCGHCFGKLNRFPPNTCCWRVQAVDRKTNLNDASWVSNALPISALNGKWSVTGTNTPSSGFYRLSK